MAIKKGDLVKVIELVGSDEFYEVELNKTYKVLSVCDNYVEINAGKGDRYMFYTQIDKVKKKVKKKSKKDLRIEELENTIREIENRLESCGIRILK